METPAHCWSDSRVPVTLFSSPLQRCLFLILGGTKRLKTHLYLLPPSHPPSLFFMFACNLKVAVFLASSVSRLPYFLISRCPSRSVSLSPHSPFLLAVSSPVLSFPPLSLSLSLLPLSLVVLTPQLQPLSHHFRRVPGAALTTSNHRSN